jgi:hypothetical protein
MVVIHSKLSLAKICTKVKLTVGCTQPAGLFQCRVKLPENEADPLTFM